MEDTCSRLCVTVVVIELREWHLRMGIILFLFLYSVTNSVNEVLREEMKKEMCVFMACLFMPQVMLLIDKQVRLNMRSGNKANDKDKLKKTATFHFFSPMEFSRLQRLKF